MNCRYHVIASSLLFPIIIPLYRDSLDTLLRRMIGEHRTYFFIPMLPTLEVAIDLVLSPDPQQDEASNFKGLALAKFNTVNWEIFVIRNFRWKNFVLKIFRRVGVLRKYFSTKILQHSVCNSIIGFRAARAHKERQARAGGRNVRRRLPRI